MNEQHDVKNIDFEGEWMILTVDGQVFRLPLDQISKRLLEASDAERQMYRVSPSGYGIHWFSLDEDLSINGLIKHQSYVASADIEPYPDQHEVQS